MDTNDNRFFLDDLAGVTIGDGGGLNMDDDDIDEPIGDDILDERWAEIDALLGYDNVGDDGQGANVMVEVIVSTVSTGRVLRRQFPTWEAADRWRNRVEDVASRFDAALRGIVVEVAVDGRTPVSGPTLSETGPPGASWRSETAKTAG